jgi:flavin reductase (DIM6/NTAB) family NADH-FMN oxidoreductase RutF
MTSTATTHPTGTDLAGTDQAGTDQAGTDQAVTGSTGTDPAAFRSVFRRHAAGVTVVTLAGPTGPVGFTATSVVSLSADPPLVSLSVSAASSSWPALRVAGTVVVHLLSDDQHACAARFATSAVDRFAPPTRWTTLATGEPFLLDAAAWLRCAVEHRITAGDHHIVIARVLASRIVRHAPPLLYHDGTYTTLPPVDNGNLLEVLVIQSAF